MHVIEVLWLGGQEAVTIRKVLGSQLIQNASVSLDATRTDGGVLSGDSVIKRDQVA